MFTKRISAISFLIALAIIGVLFGQAPEKEVAAAAGAVRFAVIGDYGGGEQPEQDVADMIDSKNVDFVATVGDNVYEGAKIKINGDPATPWQALDERVGKYYQQYMHPYKGSINYGTGSADGQNHFFPLMGDHDFSKTGNDDDIPLIQCEITPPDLNACHDTDGAWYNYFPALPGNKRTYSVKRGAVEIILFSDNRKDPDWHNEPDQNKALQKVKDALEDSTATWKIVLLHYPPYASNNKPEKGNEIRRSGARGFNFKEWGADAVIAGDNHWYERLEVDGVPYFVNGAGGQSKHQPSDVRSPYSKKIVSNDFGAMIIDADDEKIVFKYFTVGNQANPQDTFTLQKQVNNNDSKFEVDFVKHAQASRSTWYTVDLQNSYDDPVVVMGVPSYNGSDPLTMRVRNITGNSFQYQFDEWDYLDGSHGAVETVSYMVMEAGTHTINGRKWHAQTVSNVDHKWKSVSLSSPNGTLLNGTFGSGATLLAQVVANSTGESAVTPRISSFNGNSFNVRVQEEQEQNDIHTTVKVGTITTWGGGGQMDNYWMKAGTDSKVNHEFSSGEIEFGRTFDDPMFFAQITSYVGADTAALRYRSLTPTGVQIKLEEEKSEDSEVAHVDEIVKWLVIGQ